LGESSETLEALRGVIARHARSDGATAIPGLSMVAVTAEAPPMSSIASPIVALVVQGRKRLVHGDRVFDYGPGEFVVVTVDLPVSGHFIDASPQHPCLGIGLDLRSEVIASLLLQMPAERRRSGGAASPMAPPLAVSPAPDDLLDAMLRLARLLDRPADSPVLGPMIEREIAWRLMTGSQGTVVRQIGVRDSAFSRIGRAIRWIRDHPAESFRVEDLADQASMSLSTFHRQFRAVTSMSPVQFQKKVRLQQARLLLVGQGFDAAQAAFAVGYDSASQFTREYRREFGAPPAKDAAWLRSQAAQGAMLSPL
jgi:AraC-like DNA-binding protein